MRSPTPHSSHSVDHTDFSPGGYSDVRLFVPPGRLITARHASAGTLVRGHGVLKGHFMKGVLRKKVFRVRKIYRWLTGKPPVSAVTTTLCAASISSAFSVRSAAR
jgi:hypothetical protein